MNQAQTPARHYEVHCTIGSKDGGSTTAAQTALFRELCLGKGIKTIVYENGVPVTSTHVMTSTKAKDNEEAQTAMATIAAVASQAGVAVIRRKIEVSPRLTDIVTGKDYFELHVMINCEDISKVPFDKKLWSVSRNIEKSATSYTLTMRGRKMDLKQFKKQSRASMKGFESFIDPMKSAYVERCIFDDNTELDNDWIKKAA